MWQPAKIRASLVREFGVRGETLNLDHRRRMRATNMLERQNQELKRRTRVVHVFPNEQSCLRLACALLMETN